MPTTTYNQTDTTPTDGPQTACSGRTAAVNMGSSQIAVGGTAGVTPALVTIIASVTRCAYGFETPPNVPGLTTWIAGNYTVNLDVTIGNANLVWDEVYICRLNNAGVSQGTVGSLTAQGVSLTAAGLKTLVVSGSPQSPSASDVLYAVIVFTNSAGSSQNLTVLYDSSITAPWPGVAASIGRQGLTQQSYGRVAYPKPPRPARVPSQVVMGAPGIWR
jgi:hypothetical protein